MPDGGWHALSEAKGVVCDCHTHHFVLVKVSSLCNSTIRWGQSELLSGFARGRSRD